MNRNSNLDLIRLFAFVLLVTCHTCDPFNAAATYGAGEPNPEFTRWGAVCGSVVRPCVPLFVMLTGALLLGCPMAKAATGELEMGSFYRKRIPRVLWPFLIWSVLYYVFPWLLGLLGYGEATVTMFFPWAETTDQGFLAAWERLYRIPFNFSYVACHMWYIYMLIGIYLYLPIFNCWVERASKRQKQFFLLMWGLSTCLPYLTEFVSPYSFGTCDWNSYGLFYSFAGFNGYLLLGHYIKHYVDLPLGRAVAIGLPLFAAGYVVNLLGYRSILMLADPTPQQVELFWTYCTPNVLLMSVSLYLVLLKVPVRSMRTKQLLASLTNCGFGIYMIHYFFVGPTFEAIAVVGVPVSLRVPLAGVAVLIEAWMAVALLKHLLSKPVSRILLG